MYIGFDVYGFEQNAKEDQASIEKASQLCKMFWLILILLLFMLLFLVNSFVEEEISNGIAPERIVSRECFMILIVFLFRFRLSEVFLCEY